MLEVISDSRDSPEQLPRCPEHNMRPSCCAAVLMTQLDSNVNEALRTKMSDTLMLTLSQWRVNTRRRLNVSL